MGTVFVCFIVFLSALGFVLPACIHLFLPKHCIPQIPNRAMPCSTSIPLQMHLSIQPSLQHGPKHFRLVCSFSFYPSSSSFAVLLLDLLLLPRLLLFCRRTQRCRSCWGCTAWGPSSSCSRSASSSSSSSSLQGNSALQKLLRVHSMGEPPFPVTRHSFSFPSFSSSSFSGPLLFYLLLLLSHLPFLCRATQLCRGC